MNRKKYKWVLLIGSIIVVLGVGNTLYCFNAIVAPAVPVCAVHFSDTGDGTYIFKFLGESIVFRKQDDYYLVIKEQCDSFVIAVNRYIAEIGANRWTDLMKNAGFD